MAIRHAKSHIHRADCRSENIGGRWLHIRFAVERLQSTLKGILYRVHSLKREPSISTQAGTSSIVVPSTGLSVDSLAAYIRTFVKFDRHRSVSGEITVAQNKLWLRLRIDGRDCHVSAKGSDLERPDDLYMDGAQKIMEELAPYHLAVYLERSDLSKSIEIANRIIANPKEWGSEVPWAHTLLGNILRHQHNAKEAIFEYNKAISEVEHKRTWFLWNFASRAAAPHYYNLGSALNLTKH